MKDKNPAAVELGRLGGKARARKLTPARRKEIASRAAKARWAKSCSHLYYQDLTGPICLKCSHRPS